MQEDINVLTSEHVGHLCYTDREADDPVRPSTCALVAALI